MIKVGITHGDMNGIGYEVILKTFAEPSLTELCTPVIYGSSRAMFYYRKMFGSGLNPHSIARAEDAAPNKVNMLDCFAEEVDVTLGVPTPQAGAAALQALEEAVRDLKAGHIDVLLTAPINKHSIQNEQFHFPGHTEYLEEKLGEGKHKALMILMNENIRVALATGHLPLSQVSAALTVEGITDKIILFNRALREDFRVVRPRIAVLSLNPHTGENGLLGAEEESIIRPAIRNADQQNITVFGPYAADGFFGSGSFTKFDGILAMYHDQGLIPFKTLVMDEGVNYTAGLPYVRTSPAHGTAYDIAGQNKASEASFRQALYTAIDIFRNRAEYKKATANPLRKQYYDRGGDNENLDLSGDEGATL